MPSTVPKRIKEILAVPPESRSVKQRRRLAEWERQDARARLDRIEHELHALADAIDAAGGARGIYHDPHAPVFSKECRMGRPEDCHWYPCCNPAHADPRRTYTLIARRLQRAS